MSQIKDKVFKEFTFECPQCGAYLIFDAKVRALKCEYCSYSKKIEDEDTPIIEYDFEKALEKINKNLSKKPLKNIKAKCPKCSGEFELKSYQRTTICPYCKTPIITNLDIFYDLHPESLLPFKLDKKIAKDKFKNWLGSLWFAPNDLKKYASSKSLDAIYLPFWTFDSDTRTYYEGQRGDIYYVYVDRIVYENGVRKLKRFREERIRWSYKSGMVRRFFDDILVSATKTLPKIIANKLSPWDLDNLIPFEEAYLSGYQSEIYQVALDEGFKEAAKKMEDIIIMDVRRDIGGDRQKILSMKVYYDNVTFKYILLPIYKGEFEYKGKKYFFAINARTGKVYGKRPYSYIKITLVVLLALFILVALFSYEDFLNSGYSSYIEYLKSFFN